MANKNVILKDTNNVLLPQTEGTNILSSGVNKDYVLVADGKGYANWQERTDGTAIYKHEIYVSGVSGHFEFYSLQALPCANISALINMIPKTLCVFGYRLTGYNYYVKDNGFEAQVGGSNVVLKFSSTYAQSSYTLTSIEYDIVSEV